VLPKDNLVLRAPIVAQKVVAQGVMAQGVGVVAQGVVVVVMAQGQE